MFTISFSTPSQISNIYNGMLTSITRVTSKREPSIGDCVQLYYKQNSPNKLKKYDKQNVCCTSCLLSKIVTGKKCVYYAPDTYSIDVRCPQFVNFIGYGKVKSLTNFEDFDNITDKEEWALSQGFSTVEEANDYYHKLMGKEWMSYPLTVVKFDYLGIRG